MSKATPFNDIHGVPIHVGDLIRVKHFRHYRNRRQMYLYFRVGEKQHQYVVHNWKDLNPDHHQCLLEHCGIETVEVVADDGTEDEMFCERKRVRHE